MEYWDEPELISVLHTDAQLQRRAAQLSFSSSFLVAVKDLRRHASSPAFCAAMGVVDMHVHYINRRVLGNIETTNATRGHIHRYIHTNIPRDVGRCHDQCGARSGLAPMTSSTWRLLF